MLKKFPQNNEIKTGDILYYIDIGGIYNNHPMIVISQDTRNAVRVRYYSKSSQYHCTCELSMNSFYTI